MSRYGAAPESLGLISLHLDEVCHYMYLPVAIPESDYELRLPPHLEFARGLINRARSSETMRGNLWTHMYLTVRHGFATPGNPLNRPGWHADGFGGRDINYVWTDRFPTVFAVQEFDQIDPDHAGSMRQFEQQIRPESLVTYRDRELLRLDPYVVHTPPEIPAPGGWRRFVKVSFSNDRYDLQGNSHNYLIPYSWPMHPRELVRNDPARAGQDSTGAA